MPLLTVTASAFGLSQLFLSLLLMFRLHTWGVREWLFCALLLAAASHLLVPFLPPGAAALAGPWATAIPGLFWLFSGAVFDDHFRLSAMRWVPVLITVVLPMAGMAAGRPSSWEWMLFTLPQALEFVLLGLALWVVVQFWPTDLVATRRRLRAWFVGLIGMGVFLLILAREVLFPGQAWVAAWQYVFVAVLLFGINLMLLSFRRGALFDLDDERQPLADEEIASQHPRLAARAAVRPAVDVALLARIQAFMESECAWREMGLTIGRLAARLEVPEYRLRQAINAGLGYRNVSDFLNSYRIREASARLADPADAGLPVLTIAMDAGFRSLSSFNKAFKEAHQVTPTRYRKERSAPDAEKKC